MVWIVQSRPFKKNKLKYPKQKQNRSIDIPIKQIIKLFWIIITLSAFIYWVVFILKTTIFSDRYTIINVTFAENSVKKYDDPYLYKDIKEDFLDNNYYIIKFFKENKIKRKHTQRKPIIKDINVWFVGSGEVTIDVEFYEPDFLVTYKSIRFWVLWNFVFQLFTGNSLGIDAQELELPQYVWDIKDIDWLFFSVKQEQMFVYLKQLAEAFPNNQRIVFFAGAQRILVVDDKKNIYFNLFKSLTEQIDNYKKLEKYYTEFQKVSEADLWSLSSEKIIIKK